MSLQDWQLPASRCGGRSPTASSAALPAGTIAPGEKLPGETEIAETYRVNRHTVRRALATLAERGLVRAERGSGTYVEAQRRSPIRCARARDFPRSSAPAARSRAGS